MIAVAGLLMLVITACGVDTPLPTRSGGIPSAKDTRQTTSAESRPSPLATPQASFDLETYMVAMVDCLRDAGWDVALNDTGDGFSVGSLSPARQPLIEAARIACDERVGPAPPPRQLSEAEIRERYQFLLGVRDCLIDAGFSVTSPPSEDAFIDSWATGPWSPYDGIADLDRALEACPQI